MKKSRKTALAIILTLILGVVFCSEYACMSVPVRAATAATTGREFDDENATDAEKAAHEAIDSVLPQIAGKVTITGRAEYGNTLTAEVEIENDAPGRISYTWVRYYAEATKWDEEPDSLIYLDQEKVVGNEQTYVIRKNDVGCMIGVIVTTTDTRGDLRDIIDFEHNGDPDGDYGEDHLVHKFRITIQPEEFKLQYRIAVADDGKITYTVTIPLTAGCEYSFDGVEWSDKNEKKEVEPGTEIEGYMRFKESDLTTTGGVRKATLKLPEKNTETKAVETPGAATKAQQDAVRKAVKAEQKKEAEKADKATKAEAEKVSGAPAIGDDSAAGGAAAGGGSDGSAAGGDGAGAAAAGSDAAGAQGAAAADGAGGAAAQDAAQTGVAAVTGDAAQTGTAADGTQISSDTADGTGEGTAADEKTEGDKELATERVIVSEIDADALQADAAPEAEKAGILTIKGVDVTPLVPLVILLAVALLVLGGGFAILMKKDDQEKLDR